jgi:large subunit ribosomal protein L25
MSEASIIAEKRSEVGKRATKSLRREGKVPGVYYAHGEEPMHVFIDEKVLRSALQGAANILDLKIGKASKKCVVREVQWEPIYGSPLHVDLFGVRMDEKVAVDVPVRIIGEATGVKLGGGGLQIILHQLSVEALPGDIPEHISLDVSALDIGDGIRVEDISLENAEILEEPNQTIVLVQPPRLATVEMPEEEKDDEAVEEAATE